MLHSAMRCNYVKHKYFRCQRFLCCFQRDGESKLKKMHGSADNTNRIMRMCTEVMYVFRLLWRALLT
jgi:hypothetical protein